MKRISEKSIAVVYTGGTIGGRQKQEHEDIKKDKQAKLFFSDLKKLLRKEFPYPCTPIEVPTLAELSEQFYPEGSWGVIVHNVQRCSKNKPDGILLIHGTDTLAYTAAFLAFEFQPLKIPIVLTGANEPLLASHSDAKQNLWDAFWLFFQDIPSGVIVSFSGIPGKGSQIHAGVKTRKLSFNQGNSFGSANALPLGEIEIARPWVSGHVFPKRRLRVTNHALWERISESKGYNTLPPLEKVTASPFLFKVHPGFRPQVIENALEQAIAEDSRGIILELYNSGTACTKGKKYNILPALKECRARAVPVFVTSQQLGDVKLHGYGSSGEISDAGAVALRKMTTECAYAKLTWVLSHTQDAKRVRQLMQQDFLGELS